MNEMQVLQGEKVTLRPIAYADTDKIVEWRNNPFVRNNFIFQEPFTNEMHTHWMNTKVARGEVIQYIIVENKSGRAVGSVYFRDINLVHNNAEFGIFIGEDFARSKGYGYEATKIFSDFGLRTLGLHRIFLRVFEMNEAAIKCYVDAGFCYEGTAKEMVRLNGAYHNIVFMSKIW